MKIERGWDWRDSLVIDPVVIMFDSDYNDYPIYVYGKQVFILYPKVTRLTLLHVSFCCRERPR